MAELRELLFGQHVVFVHQEIVAVRQGKRRAGKDRAVQQRCELRLEVRRDERTTAVTRKVVLGALLAGGVQELLWSHRGVATAQVEAPIHAAYVVRIMSVACKRAPVSKSVRL